MQVFIETLSVRNFTLSVEPFDTIKKVKLKLEDKEGIPHQIQTLFYTLRSFRPLEDEMTLNQYGIHNGSTLEIQLDFKHLFYVIYNEIGDKLDISIYDLCPCCHDVNQLKNKINEILGIKPQFQELNLDGYILKDNKVKLKDYGITSGAEIKLLLK